VSNQGFGLNPLTVRPQQFLELCERQRIVAVSQIGEHGRTAIVG